MSEGEHDSGAGGERPPDSDLIRHAQREAEELRRAGGSAHGRIVAPDVPGYELVREIHRGGQGVVYEAVQLSTRRRVAIKFLREGFLSDDRERARFEREVDVLSQLSHPNIVVIQDTGVAEGVHYHVMDYIDGLPLDVFLVESKLDVHAMLDLFRKICDAVSAAHLRGVIHRDLKPANILIDDGGEPHILDFGLARLVTDTADEKTPVMTITGQFVGSLPWASPEQAEGLPDKIDVRTDVYSLGVILYQMLTGRFPYEVVGAMRDVLENILHKAPARPSTVRRGINNEIETIVLKCLSKERERRYQSAGEVARDIGHYLNGEPIEAKRDSGWYVLRKTLARHRAVAGVVLLVLVLLTGWGVTMAVLLAEAMDARAAEAERADQLDHVVQFQQAQLSGIDTALMGLRLRSTIVEQKRAALMRVVDPDAEAIRVTLEELERLLAGVNFTNVAMKSLEENIFDRAIAAIHEQFVDDRETKAMLLDTLAETLIHLGMYEKALPLQLEALEILRQESGDDSPETMRLLTEYANLLSWLGRDAEAIDILRANLIDQQHILGDDHEDTLLTKETLSTILQLSGKEEEAEGLCHEVFESLLRLFGEEDERTLRVRQQIGVFLMNRHEPVQGEAIFREVLEAQRRILGNSHQDTLSTAAALADALIWQDKLDEALAVLDAIIPEIRRQRGDEHPETLDTTLLMAHLLMELGRFSEAEALHRQVLATRRRVLGPDHPDALDAQAQLARLLSIHRDSLAEAEALAADVVERLRLSLGQEHSQTLLTSLTLAELLLTQGRYDEYRQTLQELREPFERVFGHDHWETLSLCGMIASTLQFFGETAEAEQMVRSTLARAEQTLGEYHEVTTELRVSLGELLISQRRYDEAERHLRTAHERHLRLLGEHHSTTLTATRLLAETLRLLQRYEESIEFAAKAVEHLRDRFGDDAEVALALAEFAATLHEVSDRDRAQAAAAEAIQILERSPRHPIMLHRNALELLLALYEQWHEQDSNTGHDVTVSILQERLAELDGPHSAP